MRSIKRIMLGAIQHNGVEEFLLTMDNIDIAVPQWALHYEETVATPQLTLHIESVGSESEACNWRAYLPQHYIDNHESLEPLALKQITVPAISYTSGRHDFKQPAFDLILVRVS